jgi:N-acetylglucosamine-6-phosphate deacetylase
MVLEGNLPGRGCARVEVSGGQISRVTMDGPERADVPVLSPGLVDLQLNGCVGVDFSSPTLTPEEATRVLPALWNTGTTAFCPTLITNTIDALARSFRVLEAARRAARDFARCVPCYHLEGPYLSPGDAHGVHNPAFMHAPDWDEFQALQEAAGGNIGIVTVAPEWPGTAAFIERAAQSGVIVSIGHTDGGPDDVHAAVAAGARMSTHLANGCGQMLDRHFNPIWAQLACEELTSGIICDGFHLPTDVVKVIFRMKGPRRTVLVTDASHVAGMPPGPYTMVGTPIELLPNGKVIRFDGACLAGSALTMDQAVSRFMRLSGASLPDALEAATRTPARLLGRDSLCSEIAPGIPANLLVARHREGAFEVEQVYLAGDRVVS